MAVSTTANESVSARELALKSLLTQRLCVWSGPLLIVLTGSAIWLVMGFIPPPSPSASADTIRQMYIDHQTRIRVGLILTVVSCGLAFPWAVAIAVQMQRIEGRWSPMALSQLIAGIALPILYILPVIAWATAAFRPDERSAELTRFANDLGWFPFVGWVHPLSFRASPSPSPHSAISGPTRCSSVGSGISTSGACCCSSPAR